MSGNYWDTKSRATRRRFLKGGAASVVGVSAFAAVGCGDDDDDDGGGAPAPAATTAAAGGSPSPAASSAPPTQAAGFLASLTPNPPEQWADADVKVGGKAVRITDRAFQFDLSGGSSHSNGGDSAGPVYSKMIRYNVGKDMKNVNNPNLVPDLADSWEQPDDNTVIFTLAPGIKFQNVEPLNGRALTVDDIKYAFTRGATHAKSAWKHYFSLVSAIEDVGGGKVRFKFNNPYPPALQMLGFTPLVIMPREIGEQSAVTTAVGTGPFKITSNKPNVEIVYERNENYFRKNAAGKQQPYMDGYTLSFVADAAARLALVESGKADYSYQQSSPITVDNAEDVAKRNQNLVFQRRPVVNPLFYLAGRVDTAPWNDIRVRQAASMLLDRDVIAKNIHKGFSMVGPFFPWPYIQDQQSPTPWAQLGPYFKYDPQAARQLLSAAGHPNGLDLQLDWYEGGTNEAIVTIFQQSAAAGGLRLKLEKSADIVAHGAKQREGSFPGLILFAKNLDFLDPQAIAPYYTPGATSNWARLNDAGLTANFAKLGTTKGEERKAVARQIHSFLIDQLPEIPLPQQDGLVWWSSRLKNWRDTALSGNTGQGSGGMGAVWLSS